MHRQGIHRDRLKQIVYLVALTVTSGKITIPVEWAFRLGFADFSFCFALCVLLGCFVLLVSVFFLSQQKLFPCIFGFVFSLLLNPLDEKEDTYKGQISEILYNPPLILPLHVLEKVKSRT